MGAVVFFLLYDDQIYALVIDANDDVKECQDTNNDNTFPVKTFLQYAGMTMDELLAFKRKHNGEIFKSLTDSQLTQRTKIPSQAYLYAAKVKHGPYKEGEVAIATSAHYSILYANKVLKGRFLAGEPIIATDYKYISEYLLDFPDAKENVISLISHWDLLVDALMDYYYEEFNNNKRFPPKIENRIKNTFNAFLIRYIKYNCNGQRMPDVEKRIVSDDKNIPFGIKYAAISPEHASALIALDPAYEEYIKQN